MVKILIMTAKMASPDLFKIKEFWNKCYVAIISVHDVTRKSSLRDSNCIIAVVMWPKFGNSSISMRDVIITSILHGLKPFLRGGLDSSSILWDSY